MKEKGLRCVVDLHLTKVTWENKEGTSLHLIGGPVFLRVCLLGQLGYSDLSLPTFPVVFEQTTKYERVFTNCRDPSLIQEVMRGEHVRIELIQVHEDYQGGKIIARYEAPLRSFLFQDDEVGRVENGQPSSLEVRRVAMNRSRKYENPPILHFNTMTSFSEAIIQSPIDVIWSHDSKSSAPSVDPQVLTNSSRSREQNTTATAPSPKQDSPWQTKTDPNPLQQGNYVRSMLRPDGLSDSSQDGTLNKPTLTPTSQTKSKTTQSVATSPVKYLPKVTYSAKKDSQPVKQAVTGDSLTNGPHCYECCPKKSVGQTPSLQGKATSLSTAEQSVLFSLNSEKPPFVVRHVDGDLISRRDFPKLSSTFRSATQVSSGAHRTVSAANRRSHSQPLSSVNAAHKQYYSGPTLSEQYKQYVAGRSEVHEDPKLFYSSKSLPASPKKTASYSKPVFTPQTKSSLKRFSNPSRPIHIYFESEDSDQCQEDDEDLDDVARLQVEPGNMRTRSQSPSQVLRERIGRLMDRCCDHRYHVDSIGEDNTSGEVQHLRASLAAERNKTATSLTRTSKPSVTVKVGEDDYWSTRMAEFTGKPNRVVFDETLEKIYSRLYTNAKQMR